MTARSLKGYGSWTVLWLSTSILPMICGCRKIDHPQAPPAMARFQVMAAEQAAEFRKDVETPGNLLLDEDAARVRAEVRRLIEEGNAIRIASLINTPGPWHTELWYYAAMTDEFARAMQQDRPIRSSEASDIESLNALKKLCSGDSGRECRVNAAIAIRFDDPKLARAVLIEEYGNFQVPEINVTGAITPCAPTLRDLGVVAPEEITDLPQAEHLLQIAGEDVRDTEADTRVIVLAVDAANRDMRSLLQRSDVAMCEELLSELNRALFLKARFDVKGEPEKESVKLFGEM